MPLAQFQAPLISYHPEVRYIFYPLKFIINDKVLLSQLNALNAHMNQTNKDAKDELISARAPSQYKDGLSMYGDFHVKDKTVARPSYL